MMHLHILCILKCMYSITCITLPRTPLIVTQNAFSMNCVFHSLLQLSLETVFVLVRVYGVQRAMECSRDCDQAMGLTAEEFWFDSCLVQEILSSPKHPH